MGCPVQRHVQVGTRFPQINSIRVRIVESDDGQVRVRKPAPRYRPLKRSMARAAMKPARCLDQPECSGTTLQIQLTTLRDFAIRVGWNLFLNFCRKCRKLRNWVTSLSCGRKINDSPSPSVRETPGRLVDFAADSSDLAWRPNSFVVDVLGGLWLAA